MHKIKDGGRNKKKFAPLLPLSPFVFNKGKINFSYKLQLHSLLSMPSMHSVNGVNRSHDPWSMGGATFESHVTASARDLPMTRPSFHTAGMFCCSICFNLQVWQCDTKSSRVARCFLAYTRAKDVHMYSLSSLSTRKDTSLHCYFWVR